MLPNKTFLIYHKLLNNQYLYCIKDTTKQATLQNLNEMPQKIHIKPLYGKTELKFLNHYVHNYSCNEVERSFFIKHAQ